MVLDCVAAVVYIGIIWCFGQWSVGRLLRHDTEQRTYLLSFALGFAELTLVSTFLYFTCRMPVQAIRAVWLVLGCLSLGDMIRRREITKRGILVLAGTLGLWVIMLIPGICGGDQYYVYRGNCTDQQTYIEETVALSMHPIGWYESRSREEVELVSDVLWRGYNWAVKDRPSAGMMIAVLRANPSGEVYWVAYMYRMFVLSIVASSLLYLFSVAVPGSKAADAASGGRIGGVLQKGAWGLMAALYCIGFWGQIQYDIDAVSQISSIAVLTTLTAVYMQYALGLMQDAKVAAGRGAAVEAAANRGRYAVMVLLAAAGLALYLESALVHGALYLAAGILLLIRSRRRLSWRQTVSLAGIPTLSLVLLVLANHRILHFLFAQVNSSVSDVRQSWAHYFNAWWLGRYGIDEGRITGPVSRVINCILSTSGMYNMTVNYERYYGLTAIAMTGVTALIALLLVVCYLRPFIRKKQGAQWLLWVIALMGMGIVAGMCVAGKNWSAGKLLYYISPYLYAFLALPLLQVKNCGGIMEKMALAAAVLLLIAGGRMVWAKGFDTSVNWMGLGYRGNYPSDMIAGLKMCANFNLEMGELEDIDSVEIRDLSMVSDYEYYLQYVKVKLTCAEILWSAQNDADYYGHELVISQQRELTGRGAVLEPVRDGSGRYEIAVSFR